MKLSLTPEADSINVQAMNMGRIVVDIDGVYELRAGTSAEPGLVGTHQGVFFNEKVHRITE